jgi:hypothetical protein
MFERYTEKARRAIFFARYEASQFGSRVIDSEHLLLGLLRENKYLHPWIPNADPHRIRERIEARGTPTDRVSASVDFTLSEDGKKMLKQAADEADALGHRQIGTVHLFLALFSIEGCLAAELLHQAGADAANVRTHLEHLSSEQVGLLDEPHGIRPRRIPIPTMIEIHGSRRNADYIRDVVSTICSYNWHWHKTAFKSRDIVIHRKTGQFSFDLSLSEDRENFLLVQQGWTKDHCFICRWELHESDDEHGTGYTNGRNWLCMECCERFIQRPDFFSSSHSEMT